MQVRYSHIFLAFAILPLFSGSLVELLPELALPPVLRVALFIVGASILLTKKHTRPAPNSVFLPLSIFAFSGLISLLWTYDFEISLQRGTLNAIIVLFLYIYAIKTSSKNQLSVIFWSCSIALIVVSIASIPSYYLKTPTSYFQGNFRGYFTNSNALAHYISSAAIPLSLYLFFSTKGLWRVLALTLLVILAFFLIETRSRGAFVAAFVCGIILYVGITRFRSMNKTALLFPLLAAISLPYFVGFAFDKYENTDALSTRSYLWSLHIKAITEKPLLGWGVGVNPVDFKVYVSETYNYLAETEKGSSYYVLPEELGIPLSILTLTAFTPLFVRKVPFLFLAIRRRKEWRAGMLPISIVIGGLLHGVFESWFFSFGNPMAIIFWLSCIYIAASYDEKISVSNKPLATHLPILNARA